VSTVISADVGTEVSTELECGRASGVRIGPFNVVVERTIGEDQFLGGSILADSGDFDGLVVENLVPDCVHVVRGFDIGGSVRDYV